MSQMMFSSGWKVKAIDRFSGEWVGLRNPHYSAYLCLGSFKQNTSFPLLLIGNRAGARIRSVSSRFLYNLTKQWRSRNSCLEVSGYWSEWGMLLSFNDFNCSAHKMSKGFSGSVVLTVNSSGVRQEEHALRDANLLYHSTAPPPLFLCALCELHGHTFKTARYLKKVRSAAWKAKYSCRRISWMTSIRAIWARRTSKFSRPLTNCRRTMSSPSRPCYECHAAILDLICRPDFGQAIRERIQTQSKCNRQSEASPLCQTADGRLKKGFSNQ